MNHLFSKNIITISCLCLFQMLAACSSGPKIVANQDPGADFSSYQTYAFANPLSTDRTGSRTVLSSFLIAATKAELSSRGYQQVNYNPDLLVDFIFATQEKLQTRSEPNASMSMHRGRGGAGTWGGYSMGMSTTSVTQTTEGTLAIDLIDIRRNQLIWEAAATGRVTDKVRDNLEAVATAAVKDMFARFPVQPETIPAE